LLRDQKGLFEQPLKGMWVIFGFAKKGGSVLG